MTKTQSYIKELERLGFVKVQTASKKFQAFKHPDVSKLVFVGRMANIRFGVNASNSLAIYSPDKFLNALQQKWMDAVSKLNGNR